MCLQVADEYTYQRGTTYRLRSCGVGMGGGVCRNETRRVGVITLRIKWKSAIREVVSRKNGSDGMRQSAGNGEVKRKNGRVVCRWVVHTRQAA